MNGGRWVGPPNQARRIFWGPLVVTFGKVACAAGLVLVLTFPGPEPQGSM